MREAFGARFALEVAFLIALAAGVGVAELSAAAIVIVMAVAWLLVCLFELAVWAEGPRFPSFQRRSVVVEEPARVEPEPDAASVTEVRKPTAEPEQEPGKRRGRFWRRRRAVSGEGA